MITAQAAINAKINLLGEAERVTKAVLSELSRECLTYLVLDGSTDIDTVNRLLGVLTPMNKVTTQHYFTAFLPWKFNQETGTFGAMIKGDKALTAKVDKVKDWLDTPNNDIWSWAAVNMELKPRQSFEDRIAAVIKQALDGIADKDTREGLPAISPADVLKAVVAGGVPIDTVYELLDDTEVTTSEVSQSAQPAVH